MDAAYAAAPAPTADDYDAQAPAPAAPPAQRSSMAPTPPSVDPEKVPPDAPRALAGFLVSYEGNELGVFYPIHQGQNLVGRKGAAPGLLSTPSISLRCSKYMTAGPLGSPASRARSTRPPRSTSISRICRQ